MVIGVFPGLIKGVAGKFPAICQKIVPTGFFCLDSGQQDSLADHLQLLIQIVIFPAHQEGEIQIAQIVEHRAAAGKPAGKMAALFLQHRGAALRPGVLVAADDHSVLVLPKI